MSKYGDLRLDKPTKYRLGERVRYNAVMYRHISAEGKAWKRAPLTGEGIIIGKRTVSDGYTEYFPDSGNIYTPTRYHSLWLVAHNLAGYRYVAEDDLEEMEQNEHQNHTW